jgi:predicted acylesterase/phospholipase RssA
VATDPGPLVRTRELGPGALPPKQEGHNDSSSIGLALSGGGVRAALFSLGVVIGLIEMGCHRRLRCLTSVSGGSIVNAALAHGPSVNSFQSLGEFESVASAMAANLAGRGVFAFDARTIGATARYVAGVIVRAIPTAVGVAAGLGAAMSGLLEGWNVRINLQSVELSGVPWLWLGGVAAVSLIAVVVLSRGLFQQARYDSVLGAISSVRKSNPGRLYVRDWADAIDDRHDAVMHVLVATDLLSGHPMYFSKHFVYCPQYGWSKPENLRTAEALYSSAAFPAVFPPKKLKLNRFRFSSGEMAGELPRLVRLADGGVYNNLGIDWFDILESHARGQAKTLWPFGTLNVRPPTIEADNVIVVNASAPSQAIDRLLPMFTVARIMSVLYDNTVRPRLAQLMRDKRPVIDISESPLDLADRLKGSEGEVGQRAAAVAMKLRGMGKRFWDDLKRDTSGTATKLTSAGTRTGARLMLHGYLSSLVLLNARFGTALPEALRGDDYFLSLVTGVAPAQIGEPASAVGEASARDINATE